MGSREIVCGSYLLEDYFTTSGPEGSGHGWRHIGDARTFEYRVAPDGTATATVTERSDARPLASADDTVPQSSRVLEEVIVASPVAAGELFARHAETNRRGC